jgi:Kef-type K+ transport system membrane component KefB/nucleotide-binding universal stress UspA family protein
MHTLTEHEVLLVLLALGIIIALARGMGDFARRLGQPEVLGQLFAGFLLGPSIFGALAPRPYHMLFEQAAVGTSLSAFSWVGAVLLLLIAGIEVDLDILRSKLRPGLFAAAFAIVPSIAAGVIFTSFLFGTTGGLFLGIVLSVTAVSVLARILTENESMRRNYAQVTLAAGIASEVLVWLMVSIVSALHGSSPLLAGLRSAAFVIGFFIVMGWIGSRGMAWAMRAVTDVAPITNGPLSLVLMCTFFAAATTDLLGLHPLLGAFILGVLLTRAPRTNPRLVDSIEALTVGFFGPIFFALAGMRVNILQLGNLQAIGIIAMLLVVATVVKIGFGTLGARLGGLSTRESALVGVGLNLKGGTDVIVAIIGTEMHLLTQRAYSMYAVVSILTVLFSPALLSALARRTPPAQEEEERLGREEGRRRSYVPKMERVLVPLVPELLPDLAASVVQSIAESKHAQGELFDIDEVLPTAVAQTEEPVADASSRLRETNRLSQVQVSRQRVRVSDTAEAVLAAARGHDLVAIGAHSPESDPFPSLGPLQDAVVDRAGTDVLVAVNHRADHFDSHEVHRILVPVVGVEYSFAAGDIAAYLAKSCNAELTALTLVQSHRDSVFWRERDHGHLREAAEGVVGELAFRLARLGVTIDERVEVSDDPGQEILNVLEREPFDLVVLGTMDRGANGRPLYGGAVETVLVNSDTPAILLVSRGPSAVAG